MRIRPQYVSSPLLLLLLPSLTQALTVDKSRPGSVEHLKGAEKENAAAVQAAAIAISGPPSPGKGTKDAPVDGLDGKPHAGPFVESTKKKAPQQIEELDSAKSSRGKGQIPTVASPQADDDGVMSDVRNHKEVTGPTGTEGGVTQKDRERQGKYTEGKPSRPKSALPRPDTNDGKKVSKAEKLADDQDKDHKKGAAGLQKPADLPDKPHDIPHPKPPGTHNADPFKHSTSEKSASKTSPAADTILHPFHSFFLSWTMIVFSEIGDKTFLVAALMAMRHDRMVVFSAAASALFLMTVLSALLGHTVPTLLPKRLTGFAAAILFFVFGYKLLREGLAMSPNDGVGEEMREVEQELEEKEQEMRLRKRTNSTSPYILESGRMSRLRSSSSTLPRPARSPSSSPSPPLSPTARLSPSSLLSGLNNLCSLLLSPAWVQTFVMTFLGEWGDRSQIATIAMSAGPDYWWMAGGAVIAHAMCTAGAVIGGRALAGRVSMRIVTLGGAVAFLIFGIVYLAEAYYSM